MAKLRSPVEMLTPVPGFTEIPLTRTFALWLVDSVNALLNYIPNSASPDGGKGIGFLVQRSKV